MVKETHGLEVPVHCAHTLLKENRHTLCNMSLMRCQCQAETERYRAKGNWGRLRWTGKHEMWAWGPESQTHEAKSSAPECAVGTSCSTLREKICHLSPMVMSCQKLMYKPYKPYIYCICEPPQLVYTYTVYVYGITVYIQYSIVYSWSLSRQHGSRKGREQTCGHKKLAESGIVPYTCRWLVVGWSWTLWMRTYSCQSLSICRCWTSKGLTRCQDISAEKGL